MRHVMTSLALLATFAAAAQSTMPWNPDANDDSYVGATDMLSTLAVYGQQIGIDSSLTCDYDGTPIEDWVSQVLAESIIIDSILIQYHVLDSALIYLLGCPDPVWNVVSYERSYILNNQNSYLNELAWWSDALGFNRNFRIEFYPTTGHYRFRITDFEVSSLGIDEVLGSYTANAQQEQSVNWLIPFPVDEASFDENGLSFFDWSGFLEDATYVNILPYWHYAE